MLWVSRTSTCWIFAAQKTPGLSPASIISCEMFEWLFSERPSMGVGVRVGWGERAGAQGFTWPRAGCLQASEARCLSVTLLSFRGDWRRLQKSSLSGTLSGSSVLDRSTMFTKHWGSWWRIKAALPMGRTSIRREKVGLLPPKGGEVWDLEAPNPCHSYPRLRTVMARCMVW